MSCVGKSTKSNTSTKTSGGKTITTVNVEETFKYSDGRTETKTRTMTFEGPPPSKEQIKAFIDSGESSALDNSLSGLSLTSNPDVANNAVSSSPQKVQPIQPSVPPSEYVEQAVDAHNQLRAKHGVEPLTVASDLCALAQTWADYLLESNTTGHSPNDHRSGAGENIAEMQGSSPNLDYEAKDVTKSWYSEIDVYQSYFGKEPPSMGSGPAYGHFTQVVWKNTKEMGIGKAKGNGRVVVVANYRPAGNFIGSYSENVFPLK